jgi:heat shock protein HslJ
MLFAPFRAVLIAVAAGAAVASLVPCEPAAAQKAFPYGAELRLDATPMKGSKRVPWLQFSENGAVDIDLWCASGRGRAVVVDRTITITPTALRDNQCSPAQLEADKDFLSRLMQVTAWRWEGFLLVLQGPEALRWRPASN